jgi:hypothetical protein
MPEDWSYRRNKILLEGEQAVHLWDEINSWDETLPDDPRRPYRLEKLNAYHEAVKRYRASLPWEARRLLKTLERLDKLSLKLLQDRTKALNMLRDIVNRLNKTDTLR